MSSNSKITVSKIAAGAGVSPATVSRVLNHRHLVKPETIEQVENAMKALGYSIPEHKITAPREEPVIILNIPNINNLFYTEVIQGATMSANSHGCHLLINQSPLDHGSFHGFCSLIRRVNAAGVIFLNQVPSELLHQINQMVPVIQCCEYNQDADLPYVSIDDCRAAMKATEYLIASGKNKIAFINGPLSFKYAMERQRGFLTAMSNADLSIPKSWLIQLPEVNYEMAYAAVCQLLTSEVVPGAFFAASDMLAAAAIRAAKRYHYHVPRDIMVVGFDNIDLSAMYTPSITTVSQPKFQEGFSSCEMLLEKIANPDSATRSILFDTELVIRESTSTNSGAI
ncbi:MAG TPA: LacI family transcriptional regulator [Clostridiales bacterium]|nr:LacI family transcriptional regulator [Clostridiales bacterium]